MINNFTTLSILFSSKNPNEMTWSKIVLFFVMVFFILIIFVGLIYLIVKAIFESQNKVVNEHISNYVYGINVNNAISQKEITRYAKKRSNELFVKQSGPYILLLIVCVAFYLIYASVLNDYSFIVNNTNEFFPKLVRASNDEGFFGIKWIITQWPTWDSSLVKWSNFASASDGFRHYFIFFWWIFVVFGGLMYFHKCLTYLGRYICLKKIIRESFKNSATNAIQAHQMQTSFMQQQMMQNQNFNNMNNPNFYNSNNNNNN